MYHLIRYCDNLLSFIPFSIQYCWPKKIEGLLFTLNITLWPQGTWQISEQIIRNIMIINDIYLLMGYCYRGIPCNIAESRNIRHAITIFWFRPYQAVFNADNTTTNSSRIAVIPSTMNIQCSVEWSCIERLWSSLDLLSFPYIEPLIKAKPLN